MVTRRESHLVLCFAEPMAWLRLCSGMMTALLGSRAAGTWERAVIQSKEQHGYIPTDS
jgi:hypothetical protein